MAEDMTPDEHLAMAEELLRDPPKAGELVNSVYQRQVTALWHLGLAHLAAIRARQATPDGPHELTRLLSKRIADLRAEAGEEFCTCESYDCHGECCGIGNCTCTVDATPDGPRRWALPDGAEATARIVAVVNWRRGSVHGMTADNAEAQRWCREIIDRYGDNLAASQVVGLVKVGPGSLFVDALTDATPAADGQDGDGRG